MSSSIQFSQPRTRLKAFVAGGVCLVVAVGAYVFLSGDAEGDASLASRNGAVSSSAGMASEGAGQKGDAEAFVPTETNAVQAWLASGAGNEPPVQPYTPEEAADALRAFFDKVAKLEDLTAAEVDELQARLLASIEVNPGVATAVGKFYNRMPGEQGMERDMLRSLLVGSEAGRKLVLQEANSIWASKSEGKFAEMYETYFNLPDQAPAQVVDRALGDLRKGSEADERSAVARLNFIGAALENPSSGDTANLRTEAIALLTRTAESKGNEVVRALAVQKLYRLNSPSEASNIAVTYLSRGGSSELVTETLNSVRSGDVDLTPSLRIALTTAAKRPNASPEEKELLATVLGNN